MAAFERRTAFLAEAKHPDGVTSTVVFMCPGCKREHPYTVPRWTFNGNWECPTFTPSLRCLGNAGVTDCHLFVTDGKIHFCSDCPHSLAGQIVDMVPLED